ncbi:MAG TPA: ATP-binding protein [bacterium]|nr:ATP-binding protein [bacterium]
MDLSGTYIPPDQQRSPDFQLTIPSMLDKLNAVEEITERVADAFHLRDDDRDNLAIAVTELTNNAIIHGNKFDPKKNVILSFYNDDGVLKVYIRDFGKGFDPGAVDNPLDPENLLKESGRGIFILRSIMDDVQFMFAGEGTVVKIVKRFLPK